ncbi:MAG: PAS domain-containing protein [Methylomonas sp.]|jgi:PAS domain S-box-containing protein
MHPSYLAAVQKSHANPHELVLRETDFVVSKTDLLGKITYCNPIFIEFSGYREDELLGRPHNILRHPDMPRAVFNLLWSTLRVGGEFFGYIKNLRKDGGYYWVFANVTPRCDPDSAEVIGYFSVRRKPDVNKLKIIENVYRDMLAAEQRAARSDAIAVGAEVLNKFIATTGSSYLEFILSL